MREYLENIQTGNLEILAKQVVEGFITGLHKSPFHGFSVEFAEHRAYNPGESIKNIDWKLYARTDKLYVKRYDEETNLRCMMLMDVSPSMYYPKGNHSKIKISAVMAATLMELLRKQRDASGLTAFNNQIVDSTPIKSSNSHYRFLFQMLSQHIEQDPIHTDSTDVINTLHLIAEKVHRRSLIVLFSDLILASDQQDELFDALQHLKFNKHEVVIFNVLDESTEKELELSNRPTQFVDVETGEKIKLQPFEVKEIYQQKMEAYLNNIKLKCAQYKIDLVNVDASSKPEEFIIPFLLKRNRMS